MMNKRMLLLQSISVSGIFVFSCASIFGLTALQQKQAAYKQQFLQSTLQSTQQQKLFFENQNAQAQAQATAQVKQDIGVSKQQNNAAQTQPAQPVSCDCYDMKDNNNLSNRNFYFDHTGLRASRITPPCQCLAPTDAELKAAQKANAAQSKPASNVVNFPSSTPSTHPNFNQPTTPITSSPTSNGGAKNSGAGQFNIKYN